jgi:hypothetical protein
MASARDGIVHMSQNAAWKEKLAISNAEEDWIPACARGLDIDVYSWYI